MARCFVVCAFVCCTMAPLAMGIIDSDALVQTMAHVQDEAQVSEGRPKNLMEAVTEMGLKLKAQQQKLQAKLEEKLGPLERTLKPLEMMLKSQDAVPPTLKSQDAVAPTLSENVKAGGPTPEEREVVEEHELRAKVGAAMTLIVRDPLRREFNINFRTANRLHALFSSVCKRLGVPSDEAKFMHKDKVLVDAETPETAGLADGDVIEVSSDSLQREKEAKEAAERKAASHAELRANAEHQQMQAQMEKAKKQMAKAKEVAKVQLQQKREHTLMKRDMVNLKFIDNQGREIRMAFKRDNWLGGLGSLVCQRFGLDEAQTGLYYGPEDTRIEPHDSIHSLGLLDDEVIKVRPL